MPKSYADRMKKSPAKKKSAAKKKSSSGKNPKKMRTNSY